MPYEQLKEMDDANPEFSSTDVAVVVGANDVVNPAARDSVGSPIYGMPILNVDEATNVVFMKRSMRPGFAGIDNALLYHPKTTLVLRRCEGFAVEAGRGSQASVGVPNRPVRGGQFWPKFLRPACQSAARSAKIICRVKRRPSACARTRFRSGEGVASNLDHWQHPASSPCSVPNRVHRQEYALSANTSAGGPKQTTRRLLVRLVQRKNATAHSEQHIAETHEIEAQTAEVRHRTTARHSTAGSSNSLAKSNAWPSTARPVGAAPPEGTVRPEGAVRPTPTRRPTAATSRPVRAAQRASVAQQAGTPPPREPWLAVLLAARTAASKAGIAPRHAAMTGGSMSPPPA